MAEKSSSTSQESNPFKLPPVDYKAALEMNQKLFKAMQVYNEELLKFGNDRLKHDLAIPQQLAECKTAQDFVGVYTKFFETALKQYAEEAKTLSSIYTVFAEKKEKPAAKTTKEVTKPGS